MENLDKVIIHAARLGEIPVLQECIDRNADGDVVGEAARPQQREHQQESRKQREPGMAGWELHTRSVTRAPNSPRGMNMSTRRMSTKAAHGYLWCRLSHL